MNNSITSLQNRTFNLKNSIRSLPNLTKKNYKLVEVAQKVSIYSSVFGALISLMSQQVTYTTVPLSFSALLLGESNRRRFELQQQTEQSHKATIAIIQQRLIHLENQFEQLYWNNQKQNNAVTSLQNKSYLEGELKQIEATLTQIEAASAKHLTKTHLTPIISKLHQLQCQYKQIELGPLNSLTQQVNNLQQQLDKLKSSNALLEQNYKLHLKANNFSNLPSCKPISTRAKLPNRPSHDRVAIFIDQANLHHAATERGVKIDYAKLLCALKAKSAECQAFLYIAIDPNNKNQSAFLSRLRQKGFQIVSKPIVQRADGSVKGNLDLELGLGLVNFIDAYDTAVLVSGDADFICAVKQSRSYGKRVEVASFHSNTSAALIKAADSYLELETVLAQIC